MAEPCYVYAIHARETRLPTQLVGIQGAAVRVVYWRDLAATVSVLDSAEVAPTPENLLRHETVVEALRLAGPSLPVRFGTIFPDRGATVRALAEHYTRLSADLARLAGKAELGLTALWDPEDLSDGERSERHSRREPVASDSASGPGTRYLMEMLTQHREEMRLRARAQELAHALNDVLGCHALDTRLVVLPTLRLAFRAAYLLEHSRVDAFREAFEEARCARPHLRLVLSGPWPPYSFVTPPDGVPGTLLDRLSASALAGATP